MITITPNTRVLVAIKPIDFRMGIDRIAQVCRSALLSNPMDGTIFVFRCRNGKSIKLLAHDTQGYWLAQKRLGSGRFRYWPSSRTDTATAELFADEFLTLIFAGNRKLAYAMTALLWERVQPPAATAEAAAPASSDALLASAAALAATAPASIFESASL